MKKPSTYRIDSAILEKMRQVAKLEKRPVTNLIEKVMEDYCNEKLKP